MKGLAIWFPLVLLCLCACNGGTTTLTVLPPTLTATPPSTATATPPPTPTPLPPANMTLVLEDQFDGPTLNASIWHTAYRWGRKNNNEAQYYAPDAFEFRDGFLRITAEKRYMEGKSYTSGLISSHDLFTFTYGYVEMRARLPAGQGLWPAFWMHLNNDNKTGEIDVFELLGQEPNFLYMTMHWRDPSGQRENEQCVLAGPDFSGDFHVFAADWQPDQAIWYVDGVEQCRIDHDVPFEPMYLIANLAVGGTWPGFPDDTTPFPAYYDIDYIRVYQRP